MAAEQEVHNLNIDNFYKTSEMSLVTYLRIQGFTAQALLWDEMSDECVWIFDRTEALEAEVDRYMDDEAAVSPREYSRTFVKVRQEFFRYKSRIGR